MIGPENTSFEWQAATTDIVVLPVGALEQHGQHLSIDTDTCQSTFFARRIAHDLNAAVLSPITIATSMEHTGFRGSFSLKPETLMQVVRDLADDAARQGFRIMIVANGHGGNHTLVPVCRDINRRNGMLKVLLVEWWKFAGQGITETDSWRGPNLHASEMETSVMLAIAPDRSRKPEFDPEYPDEQFPLGQSDLTTFGIGQLNPDGITGWGSHATREKGEALVVSVLASMLPFVRDRVARLRRQPYYSGSGGLVTRKMHTRDIPAGMALKTLAGWNQVEADWEMMLKAWPTGCLATVHQGRVVGTVAALDYGANVGWIGMMLVDPAFRRMGVATRLMARAMDVVCACEGMGLDATADGTKVYERLGFKKQERIVRMATAAVPACEVSADRTTPIDPAALDAVCDLDARATSTRRRPVIEALLRSAPPLGLQVVGLSGPEGYCLGRRGSGAFQVGPVVARAPDIACDLVRVALAQLVGEPVVLDVSESSHEVLELLAGYGFDEVRSFVRMFKGRVPAVGQQARQFVTAGPELG